MKPDVRVFADVKELSLRAAEAAVRTINESVQTNGSFLPCPLGWEHAANPLPLAFFAVSRPDPVDKSARFLGRRALRAAWRST